MMTLFEAVILDGCEGWQHGAGRRGQTEASADCLFALLFEILLLESKDRKLPTVSVQLKGLMVLLRSDRTFMLVARIPRVPSVRKQFRLNFLDPRLYLYKLYEILNTFIEAALWLSGYSDRLELRFIRSSDYLFPSGAQVRILPASNFFWDLCPPFSVPSSASYLLFFASMIRPCIMFSICSSSQRRAENCIEGGFEPARLPLLIPWSVC